MLTRTRPQVGVEVNPNPNSGPQVRVGVNPNSNVGLQVGVEVNPNPNPGLQVGVEVNSNFNPVEPEPQHTRSRKPHENASEAQKQR